MRKIVNTLFISILLVACINVVYAVGNVDISGGSSSDTVSSLVGNIWATVSIIIYVIAVGCIVFAGLRYMYASADDKASIKKQTRNFTYRLYNGIWRNICCKSCSKYSTRC